MLKNYTKFLLLVVGLMILSCSNEEGFEPLIIEANPDSATLSQNSSIDLFVFSNDINIPSTGELSFTAPTKGRLDIIDSANTSNNPFDDIIKYTVNPNETGTDEFEYTICNGTNNCSTALVSLEIIGASTVAFDLDAMPYQTLSEYNFFEGEMKNLEPSFGVLPYTLNSQLFTDYAKKKRFIWMPNNTKAHYVNDDVHLDFPMGAILIKNFYYDNILPNNETRIIETRLMIKKSEGWIFADYIWNNEQTEANFDLNGSTVNLQWEENGNINSVDYRIPSGSKCFTCHKIMEVAEPIGPKPRNLNLTYDFIDGPENQLQKWVNVGYLENNLPNSISTLPDYNDTSQPLNLRARAYLDINCAHCHSEETHCAYRPMRFDFSDTDIDSNMGICVDPDTDLGEDLGHIIEPGDARYSVLHFRLSSTEPSTRMPLLGRTLMHSEGITLIEAWIDSLNIECN